MASNAFLSRFGNRMSVVGRDGTVTRLSGDEASPAPLRPQRSSLAMQSRPDEDSLNHIVDGPQSARATRPRGPGPSNTAGDVAQGASQPWSHPLSISPPVQRENGWPQQPQPAAAAAQSGPRVQAQPAVPVTKQVARRPTAAELSALASQESVHFGLPMGARPRLSPKPEPPQQHPRFSAAEHEGAEPPQALHRLPSPAPPAQAHASSASLRFPYANASALPATQREDGRRSSVCAHEGETQAAGGSFGHDRTLAACPGLTNHPPASRLSAAGGSTVNYSAHLVNGKVNYSPKAVNGAPPGQPHGMGQVARAQADPGDQAQLAHAQWAQHAQWAHVQHMYWAQQQQQQAMQQAQWQAQAHRAQQAPPQAAWGHPHPTPATVALPHPLMMHPAQHSHTRFSEPSDGECGAAAAQQLTVAPHSAGEAARPAPRQNAGRRGGGARPAPELPERAQGVAVMSENAGKGRPRSMPPVEHGDEPQTGECGGGSTECAREGRSVSASSRRRPALLVPPRDTMSAGESSGGASSPHRPLELPAAGSTPGYMRRGEDRQYTGTYKKYTGKVRATAPPIRCAYVP